VLEIPDRTVDEDSGRTGTVHALPHIAGLAFLKNARGGSREQGSAQAAKEMAMLYTIAVILLILWLLGFVSGYTIGAFIHVLLVIALVLLLVQFVSGRRVV
jgi:hypothetical protein